jgi:Asp/Glu/hydantoin racemase
MHAACMLGAKFAFITISAFLQNYLTATAEEHGLRDRMACALTIDDPYKNDPGKGVQEPDRREKRSIYQLVTEDAAKCEEVFLAACEKAIAKGADVLIPGEGILNEFIFARKLTQCNGIPILDANAALWHCATMMVNLKQKSHIGISRGFSYKKPNDDLMEKIRGFHEGLPFSDVPFS